MKAFKAVKKVRRFSPVLANYLTNIIITRLIPLTNGLKIRVVTLTNNECSISLPLIKRTKNHVGSIYFGAQMILADLTVGLLLLNRFPLGPYNLLFQQVEAKFNSKAKENIMCTCTISNETLDQLDKELSSNAQKTELWIPATMTDKNGTPVTEVRMKVALKKFN